MISNIQKKELDDLIDYLLNENLEFDILNCKLEENNENLNKKLENDIYSNNYLEEMDYIINRLNFI